MSYRLGDVIGQGAVATVHRVESDDGRVFAGKVLHASHEQDAASTARFEQEARLLQTVSAANVVAIEGVVDLHGRRVLLMELVEGPTLREVIAREAPLHEDKIIALSSGIASGLAAAHDAGLCHRDLKPANILVHLGETPKIADFGLARATSIAGVDSRASTIVGTPDYMAPECVDPLQIDGRTDLYALGCIIYEMATGKPPFGAATPFGLLREHRERPPPALPDEYSEGLRTLVAALLAKSPADRPPSAEAVLTWLRSIDDGVAAKALAVARGAFGANCARCRSDLVPGVPLCLVCGAPVARVEPGECTLLVIGPGEIGDKLDSELRERLWRWLLANPELGLQPQANLERSIPRLPFVVAKELSRQSAESLGSALAELGLQTKSATGGAMKVPEMRKKMRGLAGRGLAIASTSLIAVWSNINAAWLGVLILGVVAGYIAVTAARPVTRRIAPTGPPLPEPVRAAFGRLERAVHAIEAARHRHALRAVASRTVSLLRALGPSQESQEELGEAVDAAAAAAVKLDALDRELGQRDRDDVSDQTRQLLHERDTWSARLLSLTATLEAIAARAAGAKAKGGSEAARETIDDLRTRVEALEEVQSG